MSSRPTASTIISPNATPPARVHNLPVHPTDTARAASTPGAQSLFTPKPTLANAPRPVPVKPMDPDVLADLLGEDEPPAAALLPDSISSEPRKLARPAAPHPAFFHRLSVQTPVGKVDTMVPSTTAEPAWHYDDERPTELTDEHKNRICKYTMANMSITKMIQKDPTLPEAIFILEALENDRSFAKAYDKAMEARTTVMLEEMIQIADDGSNDTYLDTRTGQMKVDTDVIQRSKLRVETRKTAIEKLNPNKYGALIKQQVTTDPAGLLGMSLNEVADKLERIKQAALMRMGGDKVERGTVGHLVDVSPTGEVQVTPVAHEELYSQTPEEQEVSDAFDDTIAELLFPASLKARE